MQITTTACGRIQRTGWVGPSTSCSPRRRPNQDRTRSPCGGQFFIAQRAKRDGGHRRGRWRRGCLTTNRRDDGRARESGGSVRALPSSPALTRLVVGIFLVTAVIGFLFITRGMAVRRVRGIGRDGTPVSAAERTFPLAVALLTGSPIVAGATPAYRQSERRCSRRNPFIIGWAVSSPRTPRGEALNFACSRAQERQCLATGLMDHVGLLVTGRS